MSDAVGTWRIRNTHDWSTVHEGKGTVGQVLNDWAARIGFSSFDEMNHAYGGGALVGFQVRMVEVA